MVVILIHQLAIDVVGVGSGWAAIGLTVFRPDEKASLIGQRVLEVGVGIVNQAHVVGAEVLKAIPVGDQLRVTGRACAVLGLLVLAHAAQFERRAVQDEVVGGELVVPEAGVLVDCIGDGAVHRNIGVNVVEIR